MESGEEGALLLEVVLEESMVVISSAAAASVVLYEEEEEEAPARGKLVKGFAELQESWRRRYAAVSKAHSLGKPCCRAVLGFAAVEGPGSSGRTGEEDDEDGRLLGVRMESGVEGVLGTFVS